MSVAQPLPIGFSFVFLETSAIGFAKITCISMFCKKKVCGVPPRTAGGVPCS